MPFILMLLTGMAAAVAGLVGWISWRDHAGHAGAGQAEMAAEHQWTALHAHRHVQPHGDASG
jgi:hypothetical protein